MNLMMLEAQHALSGADFWNRELVHRGRWGLGTVELLPPRAC